jgi:hypothetical protein
LGNTLDVNYEGDPLPALNDPCMVGYAQGFISAAQGQNVDALCRLLTGPNFGQIVNYHGDPPPPLHSACQVGRDSGYIFKTASQFGAQTNSTCTVLASGRMLVVNYEAHPPIPKSRCTVGYVQGTYRL